MWIKSAGVFYSFPPHFFEPRSLSEPGAPCFQLGWRLVRYWDSPVSDPSAGVAWIYCHAWLFFSPQDRALLCSPGCPGTHPVDQAGLKLTEIHLPLPSECWDERRVPPPFIYGYNPYINELFVFSFSFCFIKYWRLYLFFYVSFLCKGHANVLCTISIFVFVLLNQALRWILRIWEYT